MHAGSPSYATAELAWGLVIAAMREIPVQVESLRSGRWQAGVGWTLRGKTLGIYGYGRIGAVVARYGEAFGMDVVVWARPESLERACADGLTPARSREAFFAGCAHASGRGHTRPDHRRRPRSDEADGTVRQHQPRRPGGAGGAGSRACDRAARHGRPRRVRTGANGRPRPSLLGLRNVICTPHIGYVTHEEWDLQFSDVFDQINAFAAGTPTNVVNPEALAR